MSVRYDGTAPTGVDGTGIATTTGAASLGGTIGVSVTIDDAVVTSRQAALTIIDNIRDAIVKQTYPAA